MKVKDSSLPSTGQVLDFLVTCFGEFKGKGVGTPKVLKSAKSQTKIGPNWAQYKRIERLTKQCRQSKPTSKVIENALIAAVAELFDPTLNGEELSRQIRGRSLGERMQFALSPSHDAVAPRFTPALVFWIIYFLEHHEWLCPQLNSAHKADEALRQWVNHAAHLYTNTLTDIVCANSWLLAGLPKNLSWNLPDRQRNGAVIWPMARAIQWLESKLDDQSRKKLPSILYPNPVGAYSAKCFTRLKRGIHLPSLANVQRWADYSWQFKNSDTSINPPRLKAVLLWCRALQFALKAVESKFGMDSVWLLVEWHKRAVASTHFGVRCADVAK